MVVPWGQPASSRERTAPPSSSREMPTRSSAVRVSRSTRDTRRDGGQGLPPEPQGADGLQIVLGADFTGGVAQKCGLRLPGSDAAAVVGDPNERHAAVLNLHRHGGGPRVNGVLHQLFHHRGRPLHHPPRRQSGRLHGAPGSEYGAWLFHPTFSFGLFEAGAYPCVYNPQEGQAVDEHMEQDGPTTPSPRGRSTRRGPVRRAGTGWPEADSAHRPGRRKRRTATRCTGRRGVPSPHRPSVRLYRRRGAEEEAPEEHLLHNGHEHHQNHHRGPGREQVLHGIAGLVGILHRQRNLPDQAVRHRPTPQLPPPRR